MNFNKVGILDITEIKNKLNSIDNLIWKESQIRQQIFEAHKHTETIELLWDLNSLDTNEKGNKSKNYSLFNIEKIENILKPIYTTVFGEGEFLRIILVKLKNNSLIKEHIDEGDSLTICHRTHIPIITNELVSFSVNDETIIMKEGEIWEINNQLKHSAKNNSNEDRIHMILDYLPYSKMKRVNKSIL